MIHRKSERELQYMREAGRIVALTLQELEKAIRPGVTTKELDSLAEEFIRRQGARPAFKGLYGFPASICTSINEEVVHGIPGPRRLREGDIISIDVGTEVEGYHGDGAWTFPVGEISEEAARLLEVTREALYRGIEKAVAGNRLTDISYAIQTYVESHGFSVVRDFVGHGIGRRMHEEPQVPNFGPPGRGPRLEEGMTLAIEPMVNAGTYEVEVLPDNWTVVTKDRRLSAHFEHTIAVRKTRAEILTRP
ncbi:type I methionyl aminopeptidase [Ammonifex thiophilus]|uniref:Methionine aminopeptidase n=1 Tax=Ammonifex thiophilus TaxID=444093 RepID=A0A3D8P3J7_9THEO|nr:type I methionyl aminopeptidase [Ammonifex thiophilus]RDV83381.1 type I methionyl aminopeptidase [Ammonifex thiophilus]